MARTQAGKQPDKPVALTDFMRAKARESCLVCKLPVAVRAQLGRSATKKGFSRNDQIEWLKGPCGAKGISIDILSNHLNGRHDNEGDFNGTP